MIFPKNDPWLSLLLGILSTPIYPIEIIRLLKEIGSHTKHIAVLLEGETIGGIGVAMLSLFFFSLGSEEGWRYYFMHIFLDIFVGKTLFPMIVFFF